MAHRAAQSRMPLPQFLPIALRQQRRRGWRGRENPLVEAQQYPEADVRVAQPVQRPNQDLVQDGRNDADGKSREARVHNRQPVPQRQRFGGERQLQIFQPVVHLLPHRGMDGLGQTLAWGQVLPQRPFGQRLFHLQVAPELPQCGGQLDSAGAVSRRRQVQPQPLERLHQRQPETLRLFRQSDVSRHLDGFEPGFALPPPRQRLILQPVNRLALRRQ